MTTDTEQVSSARKVEIPGIVIGTAFFLLHFLEMCVVMCAAGLATLSAVLRWAGPQIGYPELKKQFPELSTVLLALWLTVIMIVWMQIRRHEWRPILEMASTSIAALPLVMGAAWIGAVPKTSIYGLECGVACALMIVPMLIRLDHYTGAHGSHQNHAQSAHSAHEHLHHGA
jgi:hypothetical protein